MTIEVKSVPDRHHGFSFRTVRLRLRAAIRTGRNKFVPRLLTAAFILVAAAITYTLFNSYRYYSQIIDARLAHGYLTSRPGLYAAPTTLRPGQGISADQLVVKLRRAGYVESSDAEVWNGSFKRDSQSIEIRSTLSREVTDTTPVQVIFNHDRIERLEQNGINLDSLTLEPEVLTNDPAVKFGEHHAITYDQIPPKLVQAILAIEDQRFFQHPGLDPFGVARALLRNAGNDRLGQGGSTITQQLVKNTYLTPERTFRRKYAEAMLAFALERRLSKQDIFALYCNEIYLGQRGAVAIRGVEQAAQVYFGKELAELTLAEDAAIAGMIQGPSRYSPVRHVEATKDRRNLVLEAMLREQSITAQERNAAESEPLTVSPEQTESSLAPYFVDYVNRLGESELSNVVEQRSIYTTIDLDLQQLAEVAVNQQLVRLDGVYKKPAAKPQAALVALDPHTGEVLAMVGGRDYATSQLNRATDAHRQPGSTFKPFVYATALEDGISPVQMFADAPQQFVYDDGHRTYTPANFGGGYSMRDVTLRNGLVHSLNTVTVALAMRTGLARIANLTERFGLPKPERYPALALGTTEVTPLELASAYATFVNGGRHVQPKVLRNLSEHGPTSGDFDAADSQVVSPTTAYMITNMLSAVIDHGTGRAARGAVKGTALAGKTGTSRDGWFVGYSPNLVCVVWIGFDDNKQLGMTGAEAALPVWTTFMKAAIARRPELGGSNFECPEGIEFVEIDNDTGLLSTLTCPHRELIAVTDRLAPQMECYVHGNLPATVNEIETPKVLPTTKPRRSKGTDILTDASTSLATTRVDIDSKGRRTLVNAMR